MTNSGIGDSFGERRKSPRQSCFTAIDFDAGNITGFEYIHDISAWGVFIMTHEEIPVGEYITIHMHQPDGKKSMKVVGMVVRTTPYGIGVQFAMGISQDVIQEMID